MAIRSSFSSHARDNQSESVCARPAFPGIPGTARIQLGFPGRRRAEMQIRPLLQNNSLFRVGEIEACSRGQPRRARPTEFTPLRCHNSDE